MKQLRSLGLWLGLDRPGVGHAIQLTTAAGLAFAIAAIFHLKNAYWAAMPIWVVAQATRGLLLERAVLRILGTVVGAGVGFFILHAFSLPEIQLVAFGLWIGLCAAYTHLLRGVHAYGALMGGITVAIVVLPSALDPGHTLERAFARVECTLIGVAVVTVVTGFFTPGSPRQQFYHRVRGLAADAVDFAAKAWRGDNIADAERKILTEISDVDAMASLVSAGSVEGYRRLHHVHALVVSALGVMAAGFSLRRLNHTQSDGDDTARDFITRLATHLRQTTPDTDFPSDLATRPSGIPHRLDTALHELRTAEQVLFRQDASADIQSFHRKAVYLAPHRDSRLAWRMGMVCGSIAFLTACLGLASGWPAGLLTALGVTIFSLILSSVPTPQALAPKILAGVFAGTVAALGYRLFIQPHIVTTAQLVLSVLPFMLLGSLARSSRRFADAGLEGTMCFMFASQAGMPAAPPATVTLDATCLILGAVIVTAGFRLLPRLPERQARHAAAQINQDLRRMLTAPFTDWQAQTSRQILRLMSHLARAGEMGANFPRGLLSALNLGQTVVDLRQAALQPDLAADAQMALDHLQDFAEQPHKVAGSLEEQMTRVSDLRLQSILKDASNALESGAELFLFGQPERRDRSPPSRRKE